MKMLFYASCGSLVSTALTFLFVQLITGFPL